MVVPPHNVAAGPTGLPPSSPSGLHLPFLPSFVPGYSPGNWSSLIGIITAIVGNVLISFALNLQRYAHIRLERERQASERQWKRRKTGPCRRGHFEDRNDKVTVPRRPAEQEQEQEQRRADNGADGHGRARISTESDPLLPVEQSNSDGGDDAQIGRAHV